ncbi:MAG: acetyl-CoA carboxylase carboxyltransferase component [Acidimicrobiales bacterium]|jgi:acetyl-CoA carboxylase carboxyltransferase component
MNDDVSDIPAPVADFRQRRDTIRNELGGAARVKSMHDRGERTIRDHIDGFLDTDSFVEVGTFSRSENPADKDSTPGDGKIGGHGAVNGRPVTVWGDDITVKRGSSSLIGSRKLSRLIDHAFGAGNPIVHFGQTGGARIPDTLGTEGFVTVTPGGMLPIRQRRVPMATAIVGQSFGGSSFYAAHSDFVVQVRGSCLAVTSPRVIEVATGEKISFEELGGVDVHAKVTGQIDAVAETDDEAYDLIRQFLSYLPQNIDEPPPRLPFTDPIVPDPTLYKMVPENRRRAYDMRPVLARIVDGGDYLELRPQMGRSVIGAIARIAGHPVAIMASNPMFQAGVLGPDSIDKMTRLVLLADSFGLPIIVLQDVPGFMVGQQVEHDKLLHKAITAQQALRLAGVPKFSLVMRKAFGLAYYAMGGNDQGFDLVMTWPGAEIGFMDPDVGANVLYGGELAGLSPEDRKAELAVRADALRAATDPYDGAGVMKIDEVIDPADTRLVLAQALDRYAARPFQSGADRPLSSWPTCLA